MHEEKRRITRVACPVRGQIEHNGTLYQGEIVNISLNGLLFISDKLIHVSEKEKAAVVINWDDVGTDMVSTIHCVVARRNNHILGLQFDVVDYDTLMLLRERLSSEIGDRINEEFIDFIIGK